MIVYLRAIFLVSGSLATKWDDNRVFETIAFSGAFEILGSVLAHSETKKFVTKKKKMFEQSTHVEIAAVKV